MRKIYETVYDEELFTLEEAARILQRCKAIRQAEKRYFAKQKLAGSILIMIAVLVLFMFPDGLIWCLVVGMIGLGLIVTKDKVLTIAGWEANLYD